MSDNVIRFRKPKPPRKSRPGLRKAAVIIGVIAAFAIVWGYFTLVGGGL